MPLLDKIASFIFKHQLFDKKDKLLVALSGGIDSMMLAYTLQALSYSFDVAHMNFRLRGEESDADEAFLKTWATQTNVKIHLAYGDAQAHAARKGISVQMAARELRYAWLEKVRQHVGYDYILTAHHANDNLETVLLNLTRGMFSAFHGILPKNGHIVRPLLCLTRQEIEQEARSLGIVWREDSTNATGKYQRNFIRHHVIPLLKTLNPHLEMTTLATTQAMQEVEAIAVAENERLKSTIVKFFEKSELLLSIDIEALRKVPSATWHLYYWVKEYGFSFQHCQEIIDLVDKPAGKRLIVGNYQLVRDRKFFYLSVVPSIVAAEYTIDESLADISTEDFCLHLEKKTNVHYTLPQQADIAALDFQKLHFPLRLRPWQEGDRFQPLGMIRGTKKVSDFLKDLKIPSPLKPHVWVLLSGQQIAWVVGLRISERFKVTPHTQEILEARVVFNLKNRS